MRLPPGRNQRFDFGSRAPHYIGLAEIAIVGQQCFGPAELFRQSVDLLQHRRDLLLVVGRLNHCRGDHQKARRRHHRLRVVALVEAAARHRHNPRISSVRLIWSFGCGPSTGGAGGLPPLLLAIRSRLGLPRRQLGAMLSRLPREAFRGARLDLGARLRKLGQTILTARQFLRDRHAIDHFGLVRELGGALAVRPLRPSIGPSIFVACSIGTVRCAGWALAWIFVPSSATCAELKQPHLARQFQHSHEQRFDVLEKASPKVAMVSDGSDAGSLR